MRLGASKVPFLYWWNKLADDIEWLGFSLLAITTGLPALSLPIGSIYSGMLAGLQLIGPPRGEAKLLGVASIIEQILQPR